MTTTLFTIYTVQMSYLTLPDTEFRYKSLNNFMDNNKYVGPDMIELSLHLKTTEWHFDSVCVACVYMVCFFSNLFSHYLQGCRDRHPSSTPGRIRASGESVTPHLVLVG